MSKIVQAVNSMISNPNLITSVIKSGEEIFFIYKNKYRWSILQKDDGFHLWFYPGGGEIESLVQLNEYANGFDGVPLLHYHDAEIGTKEASASFSELYNVVSGKVYGIDSVLDDIISDSEF